MNSSDLCPEPAPRATNGRTSPPTAPPPQAPDTRSPSPSVSLPSTPSTPQSLAEEEPLQRSVDPRRVPNLPPSPTLHRHSQNCYERSVSTSPAPPSPAPSSTTSTASYALIPISAIDLLISYLCASNHNNQRLVREIRQNNERTVVLIDMLKHVIANPTTRS